MTDFLVWEGDSIELPKKTISVQRKIDEISVLALTGKGYESYKKQFDFVNESIGFEKVNSILETNKLDDIDLPTLTILYNAIVHAYTKRIREYERAQEAEQIDSPTLDAIEKMAESMDKIEKVTK
jgi:hypothetical protein